MAKKSVMARENKRTKLAAKYLKKRIELRKVRNSPHSTPEQKETAQYELQRLPRNSAPTRARTRCFQCGRPRAVYRNFGLCRIHLREALRKGWIPGLKLSSW